MRERALAPQLTMRSMTNAITRPLPWLGLMLSLGFFCLFVLAAVSQTGLFQFAGLDFGMFWAATRAFIHAGPLGPYEPHILAHYSQPLAAYVRPTPDVLKIGQVPYPPVFFLAFMPLGLVSAPVGFAIWLALSLAMAVSIVRRLARRFANGPAWLVPVLLFFFPFAFSLFLGQITILLLWGLFEAYLALEEGNDLKAGLWCGVLFLKPQYLPVLALVMVLKARWRFVAGLSAIGVVVGIGSFLILGVQGVQDFYHLIVNNYIGFQNVQATVYPAQMISWRGVLLNVFPGISDGAGQLMTIAMTAITMAAVVWIWKGPWNPIGKRFHLAMLATVAAMLLCGYHSHLQDAALLLVPAISVAASWRASRRVMVTLYLTTLAAPVLYLMSGIQLVCFATGLELIAILVITGVWTALSNRQPVIGRLRRSAVTNTAH